MGAGSALGVAGETLLEEEGVAADEEVGEEAFDQLEGGVFGVGVVEQALEGVMRLGVVLGADDLELDFGGGTSDLADAGVGDFVAFVALKGKALGVGGGWLLDTGLPGGDQGEGAAEAEVVQRFGGEVEGPEFGEHHGFRFLVETGVSRNRG